MGAFDFIKTEHNDVISSLLEGQNKKNFINEVDMNNACISIVERFQNEGLLDEYAESGLDNRMRIATSFFEEVSEAMGIETEFSFIPMPYGMEGGYNPSTNSIELNINSLEKPDCTSLFNTILHESRHAFQHRAVENPDSVSVDNNTIEIWRQNFDNYIARWLDYEAYREQPVESDAFDYADNILPENKDGQIFAQVNGEEQTNVDEDNQEDIIRINEQLDNQLV